MEAQFQYVSSIGAVKQSIFSTISQISHQNLDGELLEMAS